MNAGLFPESTRLGRYQIVRRLGGGETSEVLLAVSQGPHGFERIVVLKRLLPQYEWDAAMTRMLATEAVAYARLTHPAIVRLYDFFDLDGHAVLVLEYVDGPSLGELQAMLRERGERLSDPAALYVASRVFAALAAAHAARDPRSGEFAPVVHRDVSPGSVLLPWDGFVKLGDFGFAKVKGLTGETSDTRRGVLKGTFGHMAPEQVTGDRVTPRTDVYAGCLLLRELLLGTPTFPPDTPELELLRAMAETELAPIETLRGGISPNLADAMRRGLARDPELRTLTAAEMGRVLREETDLALAQAALVDALARVRPTEAHASTPAAGTRAFHSGTPPSGTMRFERMHMPPEAMPSTPDGLHSDSDSHPVVKHDSAQPMMMSQRPSRGAPAGVQALFAHPRAALAAGMGLASLAAGVALVFVLRSTVVDAPAQATLPPAPAPAPTPTAAPVVPPSAFIAAPAPAPAPTAPSRFPPAPAPKPASTAPAFTFGELITPEHARSHRVFVDGHYAAPRSGATLTLRCGNHVVRIGSKGRNQTVDVPCGGSITIDTQ